MEQIGNVVIKEFINCSEEHIEKEYFDILDKVKVSPEYFEEELLKKDNTWIEMKELLKYRQNIIDWIPMDKNTEVLEIMAGGGALTIKLSQKARSVTCLEMSKTKSLINAYRNQEYDNVEIYVSDYTTFTNHVKKKYDYIIWIDGFVDYKTIAPDYSSREDLLDDIKKYLKENGKIVCAANNPFGLRYLAGYPDDLSGNYFEGITGFSNVKRQTGFTKEALCDLFKKSNYKSIECYYPYPDYMFPIAIYSDEHMPQKGELLLNMCNFQNERLVLFNEERAFDNIIENSMFPQYSNSYLIVAEKE